MWVLKRTAVKLQLVTSGRWTVTAEVASSSLVVPAILFGTKRHRMGTLDGSPPRRSSPFLRFSWGQKRDHGLLRLALFGCDRLRIRIERHANRGVAQQLLHNLQFRASKSKQRRIAVAKSMPADSFRDASFSTSARPRARELALANVYTVLYIYPGGKSWPSLAYLSPGTAKL